jgi:hypothetical protein
MVFIGQDIFSNVRIYELGVDDESEISWTKLIQNGLAHRSAVKAKLRWYTLKKRVKKFRSLDMDSIVEELLKQLEPVSHEWVLGAIDGNVDNITHAQHSNVITAE